MTVVHDAPVTAAATAVPVPVAVPVGTAEGPQARLTRACGLGLGVGVTWLSLIVLIPLAAVFAKAFGDGWGAFWTDVTLRPAVQTLVFTLWTSLLVAAINAVMGTLLAWVLVRDSFRGKRLVELVIDIPFALPVIVAGVVFLAVYGAHSPVGVDLLGTRRAITVVLLFVTLPFVVRSVQPVLLALDTDAEQAAACLGAPPRTIFRRVVLPLLLPAIASGAALAFARSMGEYGSVQLISGGLERAKVSSTYTYGLYQAFDYQAAAASAAVLLVISLVVMLGLKYAQRWVARRG